MADDLFAVVTSGKVKIRIDQRYPLDHVQQAHRDLEARKTTGSHHPHPVSGCRRCRRWLQRAAGAGRAAAAAPARAATLEVRAPIGSAESRAWWPRCTRPGHQGRLHGADLRIAPPKAARGRAGGTRPAARVQPLRRQRLHTSASQREDGAARGLARFQVAMRLRHVVQRIALVDADLTLPLVTTPNRSSAIACVASRVAMCVNSVGRVT